MTIILVPPGMTFLVIILAECHFGRAVKSRTFLTLYRRYTNERGYLAKVKQGQSASNITRSRNLAIRLPFS